MTTNGIGIVGILDAILFRHGPFDDGEMTTMRELTEDRVYHDAMTPKEAIEAMRKPDGDQLDTKAFAALRRVVGYAQEI